MDIEKGVKVVLDKWYQKMSTYLIENGYPTEQTVELDGDRYTFQFSSYSYRNFSFTVNRTQSYSSGGDIPPEMLIKLKKLLTVTEEQIKAISNTVDTLEARELLASVTDVICNPANLGYSEIKVDDGFIGLVKDGKSLAYYKRETDEPNISVEHNWPTQAVVSDVIPKAIIKDFNKLKTHVLKFANWECTDAATVDSAKTEVRAVLLTTPKKETINTLINGVALHYKGNILEVNNIELVAKKGHYYHSQPVHDRVFFVKHVDKIVDWIKTQKKISKTRIPTIYNRTQSKQAKVLLEKAFKVLDLHKIGYDTRNTNISFSIDSLKVAIGSTQHQYTQLRTDNAYFMIDGVKLGWPIRNIGTEMFVSAKHPSNQKMLDNFDEIMEKATELVDNYEEDTKKHNEKIEAQLKADFKGDLLAAMLDQDI